MTDTLLRIFDNFGAVRTDISEDEIAALNPDQREKFFDIVRTATADKAATQEILDSESAVANCVVGLDAAHAAHLAAQPKTDRLTELRKVQAAQAGLR